MDDANAGDSYPVPGLIGAIDCLIWPHLNAPGIGADAGDFFFMYPVYSFKGKAWCIASAVTAPITAIQTVGHLAGVYNDKVTPAHLHTLRFGRPLQVIFAGEYFDEFRCVNGEWSFATRDIRYSLFGDLSGHLKDPSLTFRNAPV